MPPGPVYNWLCVAHSVVDILSRAAQIKATQLAPGLRNAPVIPAGVTRRREREKMVEFEVEVEVEIFGQRSKRRRLGDDETGYSKRCTVEFGTTLEGPQEDSRTVTIDQKIEETFPPPVIENERRHAGISEEPPSAPSSMDIREPPRDVKPVISKPVEHASTGTLNERVDGAPPFSETPISPSVTLLEVSSVISHEKYALRGHCIFGWATARSTARPPRSSTSQTSVFESTFVKTWEVVSLWWYVYHSTPDTNMVL